MKVPFFATVHGLVLKEAGDDFPVPCQKDSAVRGYLIQLCHGEKLHVWRGSAASNALPVLKRALRSTPFKLEQFQEDGKDYARLVLKKTS